VREELSGQVALARVVPGFIVVYTLAYLGVWMALLTPPVVTLALRVAEVDPANKEATLSLVMGVGAIVAMLANPIAGMLSDRTTSRWGMRRPWMVGGLGVGLIGLYMIAIGELWLVLVGWCVAQLGFNALLAAIIAVVPDQVPSQQRGVVSGAAGICLQLGIVVGVLLTKLAAGSTLAMLMLPGAIGAVLVMLFVARLRDRRLVGTDVLPIDLRRFVKTFWISPRSAPDFAWAFASRFLLFIGLATLLTYQVFFLIDRMHFTPDQIPGAMLTSTLVTTAAATAGSLISGWLSDRLGRRKLFVITSALVYALGLGFIGTADRFDAFLVGIALCGLGQGVYLAVDLALVTDVLPNKELDAAKDLGIFNLASALPQSIAPAIAPIFLAIGAGANNYVALFIAAAVFAFLGALAILPVKGVR
jgi:MFS family permease